MKFLSFVLVIFYSNICWSVCTDSKYKTAAGWKLPGSELATPINGDIQPFGNHGNTSYGIASGCECYDANPWNSCAYVKKISSTWSTLSRDALTDKILSEMKIKSGDGEYTNLRSKIQDYLLGSQNTHSYSRNICGGGPVKLGKVSRDFYASEVPIWSDQFGTPRCVGGFLPGYSEVYEVKELNAFRLCLASKVSKSSTSLDSAISNSYNALTPKIVQANTDFMSMDFGSSSPPFFGSGFFYCRNRSPSEFKDHLKKYLTFARQNSTKVDDYRNDLASDSSRINDFLQVQDHVDQEAHHGLHTFKRGCGHAGKTKVSIDFRFLDNKPNILDPSFYLQSDLSAALSGEVLFIDVISSTSTENNGENPTDHPLPYCKRNYSQLAEDRAKYIKSLFPDRIRAEADDLITELDRKKVELFYGGAHGNGSSGPCNYSCGSNGFCNEIKSGTAVLSAYQKVTVNIFKQVLNASFDKTKNYAVAATDCYFVGLTCGTD